MSVAMHAPRVMRRLGLRRIALIRLTFLARRHTPPMRMRAQPAVTAIAPFAVFTLSIAKIII
ncbi:hypothetical protein BBJ41_30675 [Burkholderia stabilis]|nr:hypothetical protein BBJ41_30675 [Burkholderia stabilis]